MKIIHTEIYEIKDFENFKKINYLNLKMPEEKFSMEEFEEMVTYKIDSIWDAGISNYEETWEKII